MPPPSFCRNWVVGIVDAWDNNNDIFRHGVNFNGVLPNVPGVIFGNTAMYNLQIHDYCVSPGYWSDEGTSQPWTFGSVSASVFNPLTMAASASYGSKLVKINNEREGTS